MAKSFIRALTETQTFDIPRLDNVRVIQTRKGNVTITREKFGPSITASTIEALADYDFSKTPPECFVVERWPNGKIRERIPQHQGKAHGLAQYWFSNGRPYGQTPFVNGQKHVRFTLYREDGSTDQELSYRNGQLHGPSRWYNPDGSLIQEASYRNGVHIH